MSEAPEEKDASTDNAPVESSHWPVHTDIPKREPRNFFLLVVTVIVYRVGWIFKTESVIMPAFLDSVSGAGWVRGMLPILSRFGQSVPPAMFAGRLRRSPVKHRVLTLLTLLTSIPFAALSICWFVGVTVGEDGGPSIPAWLTWAALGLYFSYFVIYGTSQMTMGVVQGKLIRPTRRGRLMLASSLGAMVPACTCAFFLLPMWLGLPDGGFGWVFACVAICFFTAGLMTAFLKEPADGKDEEPSEVEGKERTGVFEMLHLLRTDRNLLLLVVIAMLCGSQIIVMPHYQAMARETLGLARGHLMAWTVTQNISVGLWSLVVGLMADRRGYRLTMRMCLFIVVLAPLFAVMLPSFPTSLAAWLFPCQYVFLAMIPMAMRTLTNYALEICRPEQHSRYLSTVQLGLAIPFLAAPLVGMLVDAVGFRPIFAGAAVLTLLSALLTFRLAEPRHEELEVGPLTGEECE